MRLSLFGLMLLLTVAAPLNGASYFVDYSGGSDSKSGTSTREAWKHCPGDSAATGLAATQSLRAGDTIVFKGGVTYVFTGTTGIALKWDGASNGAITYDGNSEGKWGRGRATFTDSRSSKSITAFFSLTARRHLVFRNLEITGVGGAATLPADLGLPVAARFGGGIAFHGAAQDVRIEDCVFRELGYWFNKKPMRSESVAGAAILAGAPDGLKIVECEFSRVAVGCDFAASAAVSGVEIVSCKFRDSVVWPIRLPDGIGSAGAGSVSVRDTSMPDEKTSGIAAWEGYGHDPKTSVATVAAGATVTISAAAIAEPVATFQWRKNGIVIAGARGPKLTLNKVRLADAGVYTAVATNVAGSAASNSAILIIDAASPAAVAPKITTQPADQTVALSSTAKFAVAATGSPSPTYQWQRNGSPLQGATQATFTVRKASAQDAGSYSVLVTNAAGSVHSRNARLLVSSPAPSPTPTPSPSPDASPVLSTQPASQNAKAGSTVTFSAGATSTLSTTYQWRKNGVAIAGATRATLVLQDVGVEDGGEYTVVVTNAAGSVTSRKATLSVSAADVAPVITRHPASQTVKVQGSATLVAAASGTPAPRYQWRKNGAAISGATAAALVLRSVAAADAGEYTVVATNSAGSATSHKARLTVTIPTVAPVITRQPASTAVMMQGTATFSTAASGTPAPSFQWRKNNVAIAGATAATLVLRNVSSADAGEYTVAATNSAGSATSRKVTLTVTLPATAPVFTRHPASQNVLAQKRATFVAAASGNPAPQYQWRKNGTPIAGATAATLTLANVTPADAAEYTVVASNPVGSATSAKAKLTVTVPAVAPAFTEHPVSRTVMSSTSVTFVAAASGTPAPGFQWLKNGDPIAGATRSSLALARVTSADAAEYTVVAKNSAGSVTSKKAKLTVTLPAVAPTFSTQPQSRTADVLETVTLSAAATGTPAPGFQWLKNGVAIAGATRATLTLNRVTQNDVADYKVVASNSAGSVTSNTAKLSVRADTKPVFTTQPVSQLLPSGSTVTFTVAATGTPAPTFQWSKNGVALPGATRSALTLQAVTTNDGAGYAAVATNPAGSVSSRTATLTVAPPPPPELPAAPTRAATLLASTAVSVGASPVRVGFKVEDPQGRRVLVRAAGPTLRKFNLPSPHADPRLEVFRGSTRLHANDNWGGSNALTAAFVEATVAPLISSDSKDAALIATLPAGSYEAVISGPQSASGLVIVEIIALP